jgi:hypothetical protein
LLLLCGSPGLPGNDRSRRGPFAVSRIERRLEGAPQDELVPGRTRRTVIARQVPLKTEAEAGNAPGGGTLQSGAPNG